MGSPLLLMISWNYLFSCLLTFLHFPFSQINVKTVEDLDVIQEELLGVPLLLRVWAEQQHQNTFTGEQPVVIPRFEGQLCEIIQLTEI